MVKILNTRILSILVYNLFLDRQGNISYTPQYFHKPVNWLSSWNRNSNLKKSKAIWLSEENKLDIDYKLEYGIFYMYKFMCFVAVIMNHFDMFRDVSHEDHVLKSRESVSQVFTYIRCYTIHV